MSEATSASFPNGVRGELLEFRQPSQSSDLGIPSDCDPHGTDMGLNIIAGTPMICANPRCDKRWTEYPNGERECDRCALPTVPVSHLVERYEEEAFGVTAGHTGAIWPSSRYDGTICDLGPTHYQQKMARLRHNIARAIVISLGVVGASFLVMAAINQFGAQHGEADQIVAMQHGFGGGR